MLQKTENSKDNETAEFANEILYKTNIDALVAKMQKSAYLHAEFWYELAEDKPGNIIFHAI